MLVLTRRAGESLIVADQVQVLWREVGIGRVRLETRSARPCLVTVEEQGKPPRRTIAPQPDGTVTIQCKRRDRVWIDVSVAIDIRRIDRGSMQIGIHAPRDIAVDRFEVWVSRNGEEFGDSWVPPSFVRMESR
jgi:sRNA-binding carbon storage regulator CsrA